MGDDNLEKLARLFAVFPGVGPRQAKRFVHHILTINQSDRNTLASLISELRKNVSQCNACHRFYTPKTDADKKTCLLCLGRDREDNLLMIVEKDADLEAVERAGIYRGRYFVLGGTISPLEKNPDEKIRRRELKKAVQLKKMLSEIIFALAANLDGEHTEAFLRRELADIEKTRGIRLTHLGRGLSTGTELEYSDADTLRNALKNRG